jgi:hypothetical protein
MVSFTVLTSLSSLLLCGHLFGSDGSGSHFKASAAPVSAWAASDFKMIFDELTFGPMKY